MPSHLRKIREVLNGRSGIPFRPHFYCCRGRLHGITDLGVGVKRGGKRRCLGAALGKTENCVRPRLSETAFPGDEGQVDKLITDHQYK